VSPTRRAWLYSYSASHGMPKPNAFA
jgi:hypothetical protein